MTGQQYDLQRLPHYLNQLKKQTPTYLIGFEERKYKPSELGISARNINNWNDNGLLTSSKKKGWHKFNLTECVWLKVIMHLREMNLNLEAIRTIKESLFARPDISQIMEDHDIFKKLQNALNENDFANTSEIVDSEEFKASLKEETLSLLDTLIIDLIVTRSNYRLLFNKSGEIMVHKDNYDEDLRSLPEYSEFLRSTHISVSLNHALFEITNELIEDNDLGILQILTQDERRIIELIREKGTKKVEISFSLKSEPQLMKITSQNRLDSAARIKELIMTGGYQDIKITTSKGKVVHCENTRKIKF